MKKSRARHSRPQSVADLLHQTLYYYSRHSDVLFSITLTLLVPLFLVQAIYIALIGLPLTQAIAQGAASGTPPDLAALGQGYNLSTVLGPVLAAVADLIYGMLVVAIVYATGEVFCDRPVTTGQALRRIPAGWPLLIAALVLYGLSYGATYGYAALFPLMLPAVIVMGGLAVGLLSLYVTLRLALLPQVVMLDRPGLAALLGRSWAVTGGHVQRLIGILLLLAAITLVPAIALTWFFAQLFGTLTIVQVIAQGVFNALILLFGAPLVIVALTLFYFDARLRTTGAPAQVEATPPPAPEPAPAARSRKRR